MFSDDLPAPLRACLKIGQTVAVWIQLGNS
jgi:hypothetical protein